MTAYPAVEVLTRQVKVSTRIFWIVLVIVVLASAARFFHLTFQDLRGDESFSVFFSQGSWHDIFSHLQRSEPHPPLYYSLLKVWMGLAGSSELAVRLPSLAAGVLLVPLVFVSCRRLRRPGAAIIAALLVAVNPYLIWNSQDARMYALATAFSAAAMYFALRIVDSSDAQRWSTAMGLAVSSLLAVYTHYAAALVIASINVGIALYFVLRRDHHFGPVRSWLSQLAIVTLAYTPWFLSAIPSIGPGYSGTAASPDLFQAIVQVVTTMSAGEFAPDVGTVLATFVACAVVVGALRAYSPHVTTMLLGVLVLPFAALFIASRDRPVFNVHYVLVVAPAFIVLAALGLAPGRDRRRSVAFVLAAVLILSLSGYGTGRYYQGHGEGNWREFGRFVADHAAVRDIVLVNHVDPSFRYYYQLAGGRSKLFTKPDHPQASLADLDLALDPLLVPGQIAWVLPDPTGTWDGEGLVPFWMSTRAIKTDTFNVRGMDVVRFRVPASFQGVSFGAGIRLEGLEFHNVTANFAPGENVSVNLLWRASKEVDRDYSVSLQLLDADGLLAAQQDGPPAGGKLPTSKWRANVFVLDSRDLVAPSKPGRYQLAVALYELATLTRLSVAGTTDNLLRLGSIEVSD